MSDLFTITVEDYHTDDFKHAIADSVVAVAGLDLKDVVYMEQDGEIWRVKLYESRAGKRFIRHGEIAHRWMEVKP